MTSSFVKIAGRQLETVWIGAPDHDSSVIVFLHEGLGSVSLWRDFPARVCELTGCRGLVYSRWGHGQSDAFVGQRAVDFMHDEALTVLPQLLDHFDIHRPILCGHSDGGSIALIASGGASRDMAGLVLEAPHVFVEDLTIESITRTRQRYTKGDLRARLGRHHANVDALFYSWADVWLSPAFRDWNIEQYVRMNRAPMLLIQGANDEYGTPAQVNAIAAATGGSCHPVILERCGHSPHVDRPTDAERLAADFIRKLSLQKFS